jgi:heme-degrading monooxygenase HmoA
MSMIAKTPPPPYYAVIFSNIRTDEDDSLYHETAQRMVELAERQPGYLGHESVRNGLGITISYWDSLDSIRRWKAHAEHLEAQQNGRNTWYAAYKTRVCLVERDYDFGLD